MHRDPHEQRVLVLDFGSQYSQLIARRVRETGVFCEIHPWNWPVEQIERFAPRGIILSGGPESVATEDTPSAPRALFELGVPVLGICYGMQTMAARLGGSVEPSDHREFGYAQVEVEAPSDLLAALADSAEDGKAQLDVWMSHGDLVNRLPPGFELLASTEAAPIAAMMDERRKLYGLQFHPEVTHTVRGKEILENFLLHICGCDGLWKPSSIIEETVERLRDQIGEENVILALSGGVDSSVVAALLHEAIADQLTCIFVDTGLLRFRENEEVIETMAVAWLGNRIAAIAADRGDAAVIASEPDFRQIERRLGLAPAAGPTAEPAPVDPSPDEGAPAGEAALIASPDAALSEAPEGDGAGGLLDRRALDDLLDVARQLVLNKNQIRSLGETLRRDLPDRDEAELLSAKTDEYARLVERLQGRLDATRVETIGQIVGRLGVGRFGSIELIGGAVGVDRGHSLPLGEVLASLVEAAGSMFGGEGEQPDVRVFAIDKRYHVVLAVSTPFDGDGVPPAPAEAEEAAARIGASISTAVEGRRLVFTVTLPVQGAVIEVVRVAVGGETFALPVGLIKEVIETAEHHMQTIQGSAMIRVRNTIMPLIDAHGVLDTRAGAVPRTAIVVMTDAGSAAIRIDEVLGRQEIVIDRMGLAEDEHGPFLGATIEDDGSIALVVDVDRLVTDHVRFGSRRVFPLTRPPAGDAADAEPEIIVEPRPADGSEVA